MEMSCKNVRVHVQKPLYLIKRIIIQNTLELHELIRISIKLSRSVCLAHQQGRQKQENVLKKKKKKNIYIYIYSGNREQYKN